MKKLLLFALIFSFVATLVDAQSFTATPVTKTVKVDNLSGETTHYIEVTNTSNKVLNLLWKRKVDFITDGWNTMICDVNLCYAPSTNEVAKTSTVAAGATVEFKVLVQPNEIPGEAKVTLTIFEDGNETNTNTVDVYFNGKTVSTKNLTEFSDLKLYPNPVTESFNLSRTDGLGKAVIYNIVGKQLKAFDLKNSSKNYNVSDLPAGMYIIRIFTDGGKVAKTLRFNKRDINS